MAAADLAPLDAWVLEAFARTTVEARDAYTRFEFHRATQAIHGFCQSELSGRYFEIIKDRLYCDALDSARRRSCRSTCWELAQGLCTLLAPVMSFTMDEAWEQIPGVEGSVHEQRFPLLSGSAAEMGKDKAWEKLWAVRELVQMFAEPKRAERIIGTSLDAKVEVILRDAHDGPLLESLGESLDDLLVASEVTVRVDPSMNASIGVIVEPHSGTKCPRCWNHKGGHGTGEDAALCVRCASVVA